MLRRAVRGAGVQLGLDSPQGGGARAAVPGSGVARVFQVRPLLFFLTFHFLPVGGKL